MTGYRPICDTWIMGRPRLRGGHKLYGSYPNGFPERARALLGVSIDDPVLHICGGLIKFYAYPRRAVGPNDRTMDLNPMMEPDYLQDARKGPYPAGFKAMMADPPYSEADAAKYAPGAAVYPTPDMIAKHAIAALPMGGRVGILHYAWATPPAGAKEVAVITVLTGRRQRARVFTVIEKGAE